MGSLGFWEIVGLAVLALFIFGPDRLPGIARTVGKTVSQVRREANKTLGELREAAGVDEDLASLAKEANELKTSLGDMRSVATSAVMNPVNEAKDEVAGQVKGLSAGGPRDVAVTAAGLVPGDAPFDPDAT